MISIRSRIGWTVVSKATDYQCHCVAWGIFEYALLNRRLGVPYATTLPPPLTPGGNYFEGPPPLLFS